ncbi:X-ray repair cross-complementing protein 6, partial [Nowakowskiella sp. JEL0078]
KEVNTEVGQEYPPGFHVIYLPFTDDIRSLDILTPMSTVSDDALNLATGLIKKLNLKKYHPANYENPGLQKHYANLQALALKKDTVDEINDQTLPKTEEIEKRAGKLLQSFKLEVLDGHELTLPKATSSKRKADRTTEGESKKAKTSTGFSTEYIKKIFNEEKLASLTIPILVEFAKSIGMKKIPKKKADLVSQVEEWFDMNK